MLPFKKILWPTDFSDPSLKALDVACEMASRFSAELYVMHVVGSLPVVSAPSGPTGFDVSLYQEQLQELAANSIREIIGKKIPKNIKTQPIITAGHAVAEIIREAEEKKIDLIVLATHGETGWRHFIFGSVAEKVVRIAACPVLTVHPPKREE